MSQQFLREQLAVQVLDGFGQWMVGGRLGQAACTLAFDADSAAVAADATLKGGVSAIVNGSAWFPTAVLTGTRLHYYRCVRV